MPTRYELYRDEWKNCTLCHYSKTRKKVVTGRASELPADVLFVGESPGESEDVHGIPFYGQSGLLMDQIIARSLPDGVSHAINNLIGCYPLDEHREKEDPDPDCVMICSSRLKTFASLCAPKLVVTVGKHAAAWLDPANKVHIPIAPGVPRVEIVHPAFILRRPWVMRDLDVQQCVVTIKRAVRQHVLGEKVG